jgi:hypothetical protein
MSIKGGYKTMTVYRVKRISLKHVNTIDEYWHAVNGATVHYCNGIKELREYCGGYLCRQRNGYAANYGDVEYIAEKIS